MVCSQNIFLLLKMHQQTATTKTVHPKRYEEIHPPKKQEKISGKISSSEKRGKNNGNFNRKIDRLGVNLQIITLKLHPRKLNTMEY